MVARTLQCGRIKQKIDIAVFKVPIAVDLTHIPVHGTVGCIRIGRAGCRKILHRCGRLCTVVVRKKMDCGSVVAIGYRAAVVVTDTGGIHDVEQFIEMRGVFFRCSGIPDHVSRQMRCENVFP